MNWSYMAGLFDGEGCISIFSHSPLSESHKTHSVALKLQISVGLPSEAKPIMKFLSAQGISSNYVQIRNSLGTGGNVFIDRQLAIRKFIEQVSRYSVFKRNQLSLGVSFLEEKDRLQAAHIPLCSEEALRRLDKIRRTMHSYARKGPKSLRPWF